MISKVKGKTEISPNLPGVLRWFCFSSFQNPNLFKSFPVVRRSLRPDIHLLSSRFCLVKEDWVWVNPSASKHVDVEQHNNSRSPVDCKARREGHWNRKGIFSNQATNDSFSVINGSPRRSTASMYITNLRAIARVARLRLPRVNSFSCNMASCGFQRGARFAASINMLCKYLLRFLDIGPRCSFPADSCWALHKPQ